MASGDVCFLREKYCLSDLKDQATICRGVRDCRMEK